MSQHRNCRLSRRAALAGLGSAAGAAVFIRPLLAEAEGIVPQRFLYVHAPCGTVSGLTGEGPGAKWYWFPRGAAGPNYTASPLLDLFAPVRSSVLPIDGMDLGDPNQLTNGEKPAQGLLYMGTGWMPIPIAGAPAEPDPPNAKAITVPMGTKTIDQHLLDKIPALTAALIAGGTGPQYKSIQLCGTAQSMAKGDGWDVIRALSYAGYNQPLFGEGRSQTAFNDIFGSAMMPGVDPVVFARHQAQKKSVLDSVIGDIQRMQVMLPASQRPKLDAQLTAVRNLEARISTTPPPAGMIVKPVLVPEPTTGHNGANADEAGYEARIANMLEIIRCAFASDLTRVASITYGPTSLPLRPIAFCPSPGFTNYLDGAAVAHSGTSADALEAKGEMAAFYAGLTANALKAMAATPEGGGSLLDNTFGMFFTERRWGDNNERRRNPLLLFGGKFLRLNAGQYLVVTPNHYVNDVWASLLSTWGAPTTVFGDPQYATGVVPGLFG
jgi:hypothetical protein